MIVNQRPFGPSPVSARDGARTGAGGKSGPESPNLEPKRKAHWTDWLKLFLVLGTPLGVGVLATRNQSLLNALYFVDNLVGWLFAGSAVFALLVWLGSSKDPE
jgi:hypothetical protein